MVYPTDEETFDARVSPEWIKEGHLNSIQAFLKRIQDFLGYGGRVSDKFGVMVPPGVICGYTGLTAPAGWLLCDGMLYLHDNAAYSDLFAVIGYKYGEGGFSEFRVPDTRGQFIRGWGDLPSISFIPGNVTIGTDEIDFAAAKFRHTGIPVRFTTDDTLPTPLVINTTYYIISYYGITCQLATSRANAMAGTQINITDNGSGTSYVHWYPEDDKDARLKMAPGGNDGEDLGSWQGDIFQGHWHKFLKFTSNGQGGTNRHVCNTVSAGTFDNWVIDALSDGVNGTVRKGIETRPKNLYINHIIKR